MAAYRLDCFKIVPVSVRINAPRPSFLLDLREAGRLCRLWLHRCKRSLKANRVDQVACAQCYETPCIIGIIGMEPAAAGLAIRLALSSQPAAKKATTTATART